MQMGICNPSSTKNENDSLIDRRNEEYNKMDIENQETTNNTQDKKSMDIEQQKDHPQNYNQPYLQQQNNQQQNIQKQRQQNIEGIEENGGNRKKEEKEENGKKEEKEENGKKVENGGKGENEEKKEIGEIGKNGEKGEKKEEKNEGKEKNSEKEEKNEEKLKKNEKKEKDKEKEKKKEKENEGKKEEKKPEQEEQFIIEKDFDYSLIDKLLEKADKTKENIILLTTGSYNPIHRMHLEILNIAANFILSLNKYNVLCGFISPSADCYVRHKQPPLIPFDLRSKIVKTAIDEYDLENNQNEHLKIFLHTWEGSHDYFIDFPDVINEIQYRLIEKNIRLVYVCGLDLFVKCRYSFSKNVIAVDRKPYINKYGNIPKKFIYVIKDEKTEPYSSTFIKDCFAKGDYKSIEKVTFPKVAKIVIDFYNETFYNKKHFK